MALEYISNVPHIYTGTLRIAPRALKFLNFLGADPPNPLRSFPRDTVIPTKYFLAPPPPKSCSCMVHLLT